MKISELNNIVNGKIINAKDLNVKIKSFKIDSRKITKNDVFICLKGKHDDGNNYIKDVILKKAACIITTEDISEDINIIKVDDTYDSLLKISENIINKNDVIKIAITGSVGKTTTKEIIFKILSTKYKVLKSIKNYNNHIGIPLTVFNLNSYFDFMVVELGMNHQGEISKLSKLLKPDIGIITSIGTSHIGNLGNIKNILSAKLEIKDGMNKDSLLIINGKNKYLNKLKDNNIIKVGSEELFPFAIKSDLEKTSFKLNIKGKIETFELNGPLKHLIPNFLIAIKIGLLYNINIKVIKKEIAEYTMENNRLNIIRGVNTIIDDSYNSSFESLMGIIDVINDYKHKIFILGDILELGKYSKKIHKKIKRKLSKIEDLKIITLGKYTKYINLKNSVHFNNINEIKNYLTNLKLNNKLILIKGSRMMHLDEIANFLKD